MHDKVIYSKIFQEQPRYINVGIFSGSQWISSGRAVPHVPLQTFLGMAQKDPVLVWVTQVLIISNLILSMYQCLQCTNFHKSCDREKNHLKPQLWKSAHSLERWQCLKRSGRSRTWSCNCQIDPSNASIFPAHYAVGTEALSVLVPMCISQPQENFPSCTLFLDMQAALESRN